MDFTTRYVPLPASELAKSGCTVAATVLEKRHKIEAESMATPRDASASGAGAAESKDPDSTAVTVAPADGAAGAVGSGGDTDAELAPDKLLSFKALIACPHAAADLTVGVSVTAEAAAAASELSLDPAKPPASALLGDAAPPPRPKKPASAPDAPNAAPVAPKAVRATAATATPASAAAKTETPATTSATAGAGSGEGAAESKGSDGTAETKASEPAPGTGSRSGGDASSESADKKEVSKAATKIQAVARRNGAIRAVAAFKAMKQWQAAVKIQARVRAKQAKATADAKRAEKEALGLADTEGPAAGAGAAGATSGAAPGGAPRGSKTARGATGLVARYVKRGLPAANSEGAARAALDMARRKAEEAAKAEEKVAEAMAKAVAAAAAAEAGGEGGSATRDAAATGATTGAAAVPGSAAQPGAAAPVPAPVPMMAVAPGGLKPLPGFALLPLPYAPGTPLNPGQMQHQNSIIAANNRFLAAQHANAELAASESKRMMETTFPQELETRRAQLANPAAAPTVPPVPAGYAPPPLVMLTNVTLTAAVVPGGRINVAPLVNIRSLTAIGCGIVALQGCGFEKVHWLRHVDLRRNAIKDPNELTVFAMTPMLVELLLAGNPVAHGGGLRSRMLATTRHLRGTPRAKGLDKFDGAPVTMVDRAEALLVDGFGKPPMNKKVKKGKDHDAQVWQLALTHACGQKGISGGADPASWQSAPAQAQVMSLVGHPFDGSIEVSALTNLRVLELRVCRIKGITGLIALRKLEVLDLRGNDSKSKPMRFDNLLKALTMPKNTSTKPSKHSEGPLTALRSVSLLDTPFPPKKAKKAAAYRAAALAALLPYNPHLWAIETVSVTVDERVEAWKQLKGKAKTIAKQNGGAPPRSDAEVAAFRANLQLAHAAGQRPFTTVTLWPSQMQPGTGFLPLADVVADAGAGGGAAAGAGGTVSTAPTPGVVGSRIPLPVSTTPTAEGLLDLDLSHCGLAALSLAPFTSLQRLLLRDNVLDALALAAAGLEKLGALRCLDVGFNKLALNKTGAKGRDGVIAVVSALAKLQLLSLDGNGEPNSGKATTAKSHFAVAGHQRSKAETKFWAAILSKLPQAAPAREGKPIALRYFNGRPIAGDIVEEAFAGSSASARADFKAGFVLAQAVLEGTDQSSGAGARSKGGGVVRTLDMSGHGLVAVRSLRQGVGGPDSPRQFASLRRLSLAHNALNDAAIMAADIDACPKLEHLNLRGNKVTKLTLFASLVGGHKHLTAAYFDANPCWPMTKRHDGKPLVAGSEAAESVSHAPTFTPVDLHPSQRLDAKSSAARRKFLVLVPACIKPGFRLRKLNGVPVGVAERVYAGHSRKLLPPQGPERSKIYSFLVFEHFGLLEGAPTTQIELPRCSLDGTGYIPWDSFPADGPAWSEVRVLNLSNNALSVLDNAIPQNMPRLHTLDIRRNNFASVQTTLDTVARVHTMVRLLLDGAFAPGAGGDDAALAVDSAGSLGELEPLFKRLRGCAQIDTQLNPYTLSDEKRDAAAFLYAITDGKVSCNDLLDVDMTNSQRVTSKGDFALVLHCLDKLECVVAIDFTGSPFTTSFPPYRHFAIEMLYDTGLAKIDGREVSGDQLVNAMDHVKKANAKAKKKGHNRALHCDEELVVGFAEASGQFESAAEQKARMQLGNGPAMGEGDAGGMSDFGKARLGLAKKGQEAAANAGAAAAGKSQQLAALAGGGGGQVAGSLLTKWETSIAFLQVLGVTDRVMQNIPSVSIPWPSFYVDFSGIWFFIPGIMVDMDFSHVLSAVPSEVYTYGRFAVMAVWAFALLALYFKAEGATIVKWRKDYIDDWPKARARIRTRVILFLLLAAALSFLSPLAGQDPLNDMDNVEYDIGSAVGAMIVLGGIVLFVSFLAMCMLGIFRRTVRKDPSKALRLFLKSKRLALRGLLFLITVSYIPITSEMLGQFGNQYETTVLAEAGCSHVDADGVACCLKAFPTLPCWSSPAFELTPLHIAAFPVLLFFTLAVPIFFFRLVSVGAAEVDRAGYANHAQAIRDEIDSLKREQAAIKEAQNADKAAAAEDKKLEVEEKAAEEKAATDAEAGDADAEADGKAVPLSEVKVQKEVAGEDGSKEAGADGEAGAASAASAAGAAGEGGATAAASATSASASGAGGEALPDDTGAAASKSGGGDADKAPDDSAKEKPAGSAASTPSPGDSAAVAKLVGADIAAPTEKSSKQAEVPVPPMPAPVPVPDVPALPAVGKEGAASEEPQSPRSRAKQRRADLKAIKKAIKVLKSELLHLWAREVRANPKSQTYLYMPYKRSARFTKVTQMFMRVVLLAAAALVPVGGNSTGSAVATTGVLAANMLFEMTQMAFADGLENAMAIMFAFTTFSNMLLSLFALDADAGTVDLLATILIVISVIAVVVVVLAIGKTLRQKLVACCRKRCGKKGGDAQVAPE